MANTLAALLGTMLLALVFFSIALWSSAIGRLARGETLLPLTPRCPVPWGLVDLLLIFFAAMFVLQGTQNAVAQAYNIPVGARLEDMTAEQLGMLLLAGSAAMLAGSGIAVLVMVFRAGATWSDVGFRAAALISDLRTGVGAFVMFAPPMYLMQLGLTRIWPSEHPVQTLLMKDQNVDILLITMFTAVVVAPLSEEIFFRTVLQGWLENVSVLLRKGVRAIFASGIPVNSKEELDRDFLAVVLGDRTGQALSDSLLTAPPAELNGQGTDVPLERPVASSNPYAAPLREEASSRIRDDSLIPKPAEGEAASFLPARWPMYLSATVFAALHIGHGPDPIPLFFLALGLGYLYRQTHRIVPCIVVHFLVNSTSMVALCLFVFFGEEL